MKKISTLLVVLLVHLAANLHAQIDTIVIIDSLPLEITMLPSRTHVAIKGSDTGYVDSIRYRRTVIRKTNQYYYLVVKDKKGNLLLEGDFFDQYPCGAYSDYHPGGKIKSQGRYELVRNRKGKWTYRKTGEWKYYYPNGKLKNSGLE